MSLNDDHLRLLSDAEREAIIAQLASQPGAFNELAKFVGGDGIGVVGVAHAVGLAPAAGRAEHLDRVARLGEAGAQLGAQGGFVFNDQDAHGLRVSRRETPITISDAALEQFAAGRVEFELDQPAAGL